MKKIVPLFTDEEYAFLRSCPNSRKPAIVTQDNRKEVYDLARPGLLHLKLAGGAEGRIDEITYLTDRGRFFVHQETIERNPLLRKLYRFLGFSW